MDRRIYQIIQEEVYKALREANNGQGKKNARQRQDEYEAEHGKSNSGSMTLGAVTIGNQRGFNVADCADEMVDAGLLDCKKGPSAQSALRKKLKNITAPNGGHYGLTNKQDEFVHQYIDGVEKGVGNKK